MRWQLAASLDKNYIFELAETKGWYDDPPKVQVRRERGILGDIWWTIEPYEENCNCPSLVVPPIKVKE